MEYLSNSENERLHQSSGRWGYWSDNIFFGAEDPKEDNSRKGNGRDNRESDDRQKIKVMLWNVEGLRNAANMIPDNLFREHDIVMLVETMLTSEWAANGMYTIHKFATQEQTGRPKGGITCLLGPNLSPFETLYASDHVLTIKTALCTLVTVYFQPETPAINIIDEIGTALSKLDQDRPLILGGDMNCRIDAPGPKAKLVLRYLQETGLELVNKKDRATYISHNGKTQEHNRPGVYQ